MRRQLRDRSMKKWTDQHRSSEAAPTKGPLGNKTIIIDGKQSSATLLLSTAAAAAADTALKISEGMKNEGDANNTTCHLWYAWHSCDMGNGFQTIQEDKWVHYVENDFLMNYIKFTVHAY